MLVAGLISGCDNGGGGDVDEVEVSEPQRNKPTDSTPDSENNGVKVSPDEVKLGKGLSQKFTAALTEGGEAPVTWTVSGGVADTKIDSNGLLSVSSEETAKELTVTAVLSGDSGSSGTAKVLILGNEGFAEEHGVRVSPSFAYLSRGEQVTFNAAGTSDNPFAGSTAWSVGNKGFTANPDGSFTYTVDDNENEKYITVTANIGLASGTARVTVLDNVENDKPSQLINNGIRVSPQIDSVERDSRKTFAAFDGNNTQITGALEWSVFGGETETSLSEDGGLLTETTISDSGVLTVALDETAQYLTVRAKNPESGAYGTAVVEARNVRRDFTGLSAGGGAGDTAASTTLTLSFNGDIKGLSKDDITISPDDTITKGELAGPINHEYTLVLSGTSPGESIDIAVSKDWYDIAPSSQTAHIPEAVDFTGLSADGVAGKTTTETLTLTFDKDISGLAASDIKINANGTGATGGDLTKVDGATGKYTLAVSGISAPGEITVTPVKQGYIFTPKSRPEQVHYVNPVTLNSVSANGAANTTATTTLTLTFNKAVAGLTDSNITLNAGTTGAQKGTLSGSGTSWTLGVSGITADGEVTVSVSSQPTGYNITGSASTTVYNGITAATLNSVTADGALNTTATTKLTLIFSRDITGLSEGHILLNAGTTGAQKETLSKAGGTGKYELAVSGITADGQVTVSVESQPTGYNITGSDSTTVYKGATAATMTVTPNGNSTTRTTALTLSFSPGIANLADGEITIEPGSTGASKSALSVSTTSYTLWLSGIKASGSITVSVGKSGYSVASKTVTVYYSPIYPIGGKSLKTEFGITTTGTTGVRDTFNAVSNFIKNNSLNNQTKIDLGDYIDLEGGLTVAAYGTGNNTGGFSIASGTAQGQASWRITTTSGGYNPNYESVYLRLIVVGINSFNGKNGNDKRHIVFQFQNIPVKRRMNLDNKNDGGYAASEMRTYLTNNFLPGLTSAGVPEGVLWAPKREMAAERSGSGTTRIEDKLWLPTEREMFGMRKYSNNSAETDGNQGRLDYYYNGNADTFARRIKYSSSDFDSSGVVNGNFAGSLYWEASPYSASLSAFCAVYCYGDTVAVSAVTGGSCAPAFCVAY
jgi:hypothetical protein